MVGMPSAVSKAGRSTLAKALAVLVAGSMAIGFGGFYAPAQVEDSLNARVADSITVIDAKDHAFEDWVSEKQGEAFGGELDPDTNKLYFYLFNITNLNEVNLKSNAPITLY
jgi:hypothetical protein